MTASPSPSSAPCPSCGATNSAPIVYGLLDFDAFLQSPGIVPGGCCVRPEDRKCRGCGTAYRSDGRVAEPWDDLPPSLVDDRP